MKSNKSAKSANPLHTQLESLLLHFDKVSKILVCFIFFYAMILCGYRSEQAELSIAEIRAFSQLKFSIA